MKEIAYVLTLTPRTVAFHKYKLMERLRPADKRGPDSVCNSGADCSAALVALFCGMRCSSLTPISEMPR